MTATLVPIDEAAGRAEDRPKDRLKQLASAYSDEWRAAHNEIPQSFERAVRRYQDALERRIAHLERALRTLLASANDDQQRHILTIIYGATIAARQDPKLLTETERRLVDDYRQMDDVCRRLVRGISKNLAHISPRDDQQGGGGAGGAA